jgi:CheY-like chemotaxis protein
MVMKKILIVEDEPGSRRLLAALLKKWGYAIIQASTGSRAMALLSDNDDIDLIITDYMMPDLDGRVLVRAIRESSEYYDVPIIMVSGVVKLDEIASVLESGVSRFLPKPVESADLRTYVESLLTSRATSERSEPPRQ